MVLLNVDCFLRLNCYVRILNLEFGNFHLKRKKFLLLEQILILLRGSVNYFVFFFVIFTEL